MSPLDRELCRGRQRGGEKKKKSKTVRQRGWEVRREERVAWGHKEAKEGRKEWRKKGEGEDEGDNEVRGAA